MKVDVKKMVNEILTKGNLNKKELAEKLEVSPSQITRWGDNAEPRYKNIEKLEEIYKNLPA